MKNTARYAIFLILILFAIPAIVRTYADTKVEISGNSEGSNASVNIKQQINTQATNQSSFSSAIGHTKVEVNGETIIDSNKPENVNFESKDGKVKVTITQKIKDNKIKLEDKKEEIKKKKEEVTEHKASVVKNSPKSKFFLFKPDILACPESP